MFENQINLNIIASFSSLIKIPDKGPSFIILYDDMFCCNHSIIGLENFCFKPDFFFLVYITNDRHILI